jgi:prepilin-type N-terminal cleavage/methylation domain-containing protein
LAAYRVYVPDAKLNNRQAPAWRLFLSQPQKVLFPMKRQSQQGFTLVEIAIVLVVIGLLIGGVLRGAELINSSRASRIVSDQSSVQTAFYGFVDRYKMLPGDLTAAQALLIDNFTAPASAASDNNVLLEDSPAFFNNLSRAGFLTCTACSSTSVVTPGTTGAAPTPATYIVPAAGLNSNNSPVNVYTVPMAFYYNTGTTAGSVAVVGSSTAGSVSFLGSAGEGGKPLLLTGGSITSAILAEIDRKTDDGTPGSGTFRYTDILATQATSGASIFVNATISAACFTGGTSPFIWHVNPGTSCQGASLL